jgi:hypothetical protein
VRQVVRRIRSMFEPHQDLREEIHNIRSLINKARTENEESARVIESLREQVEKEAQAWHDGTGHSKSA